MSLSRSEIIRESDGFISATKLCQKANKKFAHWHVLMSTQNIIKKLKERYNLDEDKILQIKRGGKIQGTWIHPLLATQLAQWLSPEFAIDISIWIDEWKKQKNNEEIYVDKLINLVPNENFFKEREILLYLQVKYGGNIEVLTDVGKIDLLTNTDIIEIKNAKLWKHALGQILAYSIYYPNHKKIIYLFDYDKKDSNIENCCKIYNVEVQYHEE